MTPRPQIDLEGSILYHSYRNLLKVMFNEEPEHSIDALVTRISAEYGIDVRVILREINRLKREGAIYFIEKAPDKDKIKVCVEAKKKAYPRTPEEKLEQKCKQIIGYTVYPVLTEGGIFEYCDKIAKIYRYNKEDLRFLLENNKHLWLCKDRGVWRI